MIGEPPGPGRVYGPCSCDSLSSVYDKLLVNKQKRLRRLM